MDPIVLAGLTVCTLLFILSGLSGLIIICEPHEVVVLSGYGGTDESGEKTGYRILRSGWRVKLPWVERVDRLDMRLMPIEIQVENAYSEGGIPLNIRAIANVKLASDERRIRNSVERFLGMPRSEIEKVAKETLEGNLRGVLATMTPEEVNQDRLKFSELTQNEVEEDLSKLGLVVDTLKIQNVSDDVDYLGSISRVAVSRVQREATVAESDAKKTIKNTEAEAEGNIAVAQQEAEQAIAEKTNALRALEGELEGEVQAEIERTEAAGRQAKAEAEKALQEIRSKLERLRLQAEVVLPAEAREKAEAMKAEGAAALIAERGRATADAFTMLSKTWESGGNLSKDVFLLQKLEDALDEVVGAVRQVQAREVSLVDGEGGQALPAYVASHPAMVGAVLDQVGATLGLDIQSTLSGRGAASGAVQRAAGAGGGRSRPIVTAPPRAPGSESAAEAAAQAAAEDLTADEVFTLVLRELARGGNLADHAKGLVPNVAKLVGVSDSVRDQVVAQVEDEVTSGVIEAGTRRSPRTIFAEAVELALRDHVLTEDERTLLGRLGTALRLDETTQRDIEAAVRERTPSGSAD